MRNEKKPSLVDWSRVRDIGVDMSELFRFSSVRGNAPQVHLTRGRPAAHEVIPATVLRPNLIMVVHSRLAFYDLTFVGTVMIRHECGITRFPRVIRQPGTIGRPRNLGRVFAQIVRRSAYQRQSPSLTS